MATDAQPQDPQPQRAGSEHTHGPVASYESVLEGSRDTILPHLKAIAPALVWNETHFHVGEMVPADKDRPELLLVKLGDAPVGALDFLPLPADRTLMRLYLCSDLGQTCLIEGGDTAMQGFATAWLLRLQKLGFLSTPIEEAHQHTRPLGFQPPRKE